MPNNKSIPEAQDDIIKANENQRFASIEEQKAGGALPYKQSPFPLVQGTSGHTSALKSELEAEGDQVEVSLMSGFNLDPNPSAGDTSGDQGNIVVDDVNTKEIAPERYNPGAGSELSKGTLRDKDAEQLQAMQQANPIVTLFTGRKSKGA